MVTNSALTEQRPIGSGFTAPGTPDCAPRWKAGWLDGEGAEIFAARFAAVGQFFAVVGRVGAGTQRLRAVVDVMFGALGRAVGVSG
ncbi:hypothetical protein [Streptomyces misionensis]|uniref:hypothetical protein n=1 Tax=Streptomyces misionensis TaxID=67331 RepID=UPI0033D1C2A8